MSIVRTRLLQKGGRSIKRASYSKINIVTSVVRLHIRRSSEALRRILNRNLFIGCEYNWPERQHWFQIEYACLQKMEEDERKIDQVERSVRAQTAQVNFVSSRHKKQKQTILVRFSSARLVYLPLPNESNAINPSMRTVRDRCVQTEVFSNQQCASKHTQFNGLLDRIVL